MNADADALRSGYAVRRGHFDALVEHATGLESAIRLVFPLKNGWTPEASRANRDWQLLDAIHFAIYEAANSTMSWAVSFLEIRPGLSLTKWVTGHSSAREVPANVLASAYGIHQIRNKLVAHTDRMQHLMRIHHPTDGFRTAMANFSDDQELSIVRQRFETAFGKQQDIHESLRLLLDEVPVLQGERLSSRRTLLGETLEVLGAKCHTVEEIGSRTRPFCDWVLARAIAAHGT